MGIWEGDFPVSMKPGSRGFHTQDVVRAVSESAAEQLCYLLGSIGINMEGTHVHHGNQATQWVLCSLLTQ